VSNIIVFSDKEIITDLKLTLDELVMHGHKLLIYNGFAAFADCDLNSTTTVIIDAENNKLAAFELCREIRDLVRKSLRVFVYLPGASLNEASRFGNLGVEVEDEKSIFNLVNKIGKSNSDDLNINNKKLITIHSINGGLGASSITLLLSHFLNKLNISSVLIENSDNFSLRNKLDLSCNPALLDQINLKSFTQNTDIEWFKSFLLTPSTMTKAFYLNLFSNIEEKQNFLLQKPSLLEKITKQIDSYVSHNQNFLTDQIVKEYLTQVSNSLKHFLKDGHGDSFLLFNQITSYLFSFSQNIFFDSAGDLLSPLTKQYLQFSKNLIVLLRDDYQAKDQYIALKKFISEAYQINLIPIIVPNHYQYMNYQKLRDSDWQILLGDKPLIYPYAPEELIALFDDHEPLNLSSKLSLFTKELLGELGIQTKANIGPANGILNFLFQ